MSQLHHVDGGSDGDADAGVRGIVPRRYPRYYSALHGVHLCLAQKVCLRYLAVDHASPDPHRQSAVALTGDELLCSVHLLSLWRLITVRRYHVDFEDVPVILQPPWLVEQHYDCPFL